MEPSMSQIDLALLTVKSAVGKCQLDIRFDLGELFHGSPPVFMCSQFQCAPHAWLPSLVIL
jgi:hypothetical protein